MAEDWRDTDTRTVVVHPLQLASADSSLTWVMMFIFWSLSLLAFSPPSISLQEYFLLPCVKLFYLSYFLYSFSSRLLLPLLPALLLVLTLCDGCSQQLISHWLPALANLNKKKSKRWGAVGFWQWTLIVFFFFFTIPARLAQIIHDFVVKDCAHFLKPNEVTELSLFLHHPLTPV